MPEYIIKMYKAAEKDYEELKRAGQKEKVDNLLKLISDDPFVSPPKYEELSGKYRGTYSRRINRKDRLVYEVRDTNDPDVKIIVIIRMRTHYKGMLSIAFLRALGGAFQFGSLSESSSF